MRRVERFVGGVLLAGLVCLVAPGGGPTADERPLSAVLADYRSGDADSAVRTLASWPASKIASADAHLDPSDLWGRLALGLLVLEAGRQSRYVDSGPTVDLALWTRGETETAGTCLGTITDAKLWGVCRDAARLLLVYRGSSGSEDRDLEHRIDKAFGRDPLVQLAIGCRYEFWMLEVDGTYGSGKRVPSSVSGTLLVTSHGRVGVVESTGAEAAYRRALAANPELSEARVRLGRVFWTLDRFVDAENEWRAVLADNRATPSSMYLAGLFLGQSYEHEGRLRDAETAYRQGLALRPAGQSISAALGRLLLSSGRDTEAWSVLSNAAPSGGASALDPWILYPLGELFWQQGEILKALRKAVRQ